MTSSERPSTLELPRRPPRPRLTTACAALIAVALVVSGLSTAQAPAQPGRATSLDGGSVKTVADQTPIFWWNGDRWDYFGFLNSVREITNRENNDVPGTSSTIDHTDPWSRTEFFEVVIVNRQNRQARLQIRSSDLYLVGWYDSRGTYHFIGSPEEVGGPKTNRKQLLKDGSYGSLERMAKTTRERMAFNQDATSAAANALWDSSDNRSMAAGSLYFTQFVSEAVRFRGIANTIGWMGYGQRQSDNNVMSAHLDRRLVAQENDWGNLSQRYNWLLDQQRRNPNVRVRDSNQNALTGIWLAANGAILVARLFSPADYANLLNTAFGFPGRTK